MPDKKPLLFWSVIASVLIAGLLILVEVRAAREEQRRQLAAARGSGQEAATTEKVPRPECVEERYGIHKADMQRQSAEVPGNMGDRALQ
jgi:hypothetical protein